MLSLAVHVCGYWAAVPEADLSPDGVAPQQVQIRPWNLNDSDFVMDGSQPLDPRKTIFVGGVPRPLRAGQPPFDSAPWILSSSDGIFLDPFYSKKCYAAPKLVA